MKASSQSSSALLQALLYGPPRSGIALGRHHLAFGDYVVSLTAPGAARMPNGFACTLHAEPGAATEIGLGTLAVGGVRLEPGEPWSPVPRALPPSSLPPGPAPVIDDFAGLGPGLTPAGDDLLAGYVAGLVLLHRRRKLALRIALDAASRTNGLSATLLRHAALGEVPEPVHDLLATGDVRPLLNFGHTSGGQWLRGLVSAGLELDVDRVVALAG